MQVVNLRKAAQINSEIQKKIVELTALAAPVINIKANEAVNLGKTMVDSLRSFQDTMSNIAVLESIYDSIRNAVTVENMRVGITLQLNKLASKERSLKRMNSLKALAQPAQEFSVIEEEFKQKILERKDSTKYSYGFDPLISVPILDQVSLNSISNDIVNLKREIREIQDKILGLNMNTFVEISDLGWSTLAPLGVI